MPDKVPVIITLDYPPERGGVARYLGELVRASGGKFDVIVPAAHGIEGPGRIEHKELFRTVWPRWWPIIGICRGLKHRASNIVVSHVLPVGTAAMISKWTSGPPYVLICHGLDVRLAAASWHRRILFRLICRNASAVVANSSSTAQSIKKISGVDAVVVTPGVSTADLLDRDDARMRLGIPQGTHVILSVGRLIERKGAATVVEAVKMLPSSDHVELVIIGDGPELKRLRELALGSVHRVHILTDASDEHVREWYAAANVFCLPVKEMSDDVEGFGIVFLEAALAGLPVIAGKTGGAVEAVVDRETGLLVNPYDAREVARALTLLLGDPELRKRMGAAGRERVLRDFRWADRWEVFRRIVSSQ